MEQCCIRHTRTVHFTIQHSHDSGKARSCANGSHSQPNIYSPCRSTDSSSATLLSSQCRHLHVSPTYSPFRTLPTTRATASHSNAAVKQRDCSKHHQQYDGPFPRLFVRTWTLVAQSSTIIALRSSHHRLHDAATVVQAWTIPATDRFAGRARAQCIPNSSRCRVRCTRRQTCWRQGMGRRIPIRLRARPTSLLKQRFPLRGASTSRPRRARRSRRRTCCSPRLRVRPDGLHTRQPVPRFERQLGLRARAQQHGVQHQLEELGPLCQHSRRKQCLRSRQRLPHAGLSAQVRHPGKFERDVGSARLPRPLQPGYGAERLLEE